MLRILAIHMVFTYAAIPSLCRAGWIEHFCESIGECGCTDDCDGCDHHCACEDDPCRTGLPGPDHPNQTSAQKQLAAASAHTIDLADTAAARHQLPRNRYDSTPPPAQSARTFPLLI